MLGKQNIVRQCDGAKVYVVEDAHFQDFRMLKIDENILENFLFSSIVIGVNKYPNSPYDLMRK